MRSSCRYVCTSSLCARFAKVKGVLTQPRSTGSKPWCLKGAAKAVSWCYRRRRQMAACSAICHQHQRVGVCKKHGCSDDRTKVWSCSVRGLFVDGRPHCSRPTCGQTNHPTVCVWFQLTCVAIPHRHSQCVLTPKEAL